MRRVPFSISYTEFWLQMDEKLGHRKMSNSISKWDRRCTFLFPDSEDHLSCLSLCSAWWDQRLGTGNRLVELAALGIMEQWNTEIGLCHSSLDLRSQLSHLQGSENAEIGGSWMENYQVGCAHLQSLGASASGKAWALGTLWAYLQ